MKSTFASIQAFASNIWHGQPKVPFKNPRKANLDINTNFTACHTGLTSAQQQGVRDILLSTCSRLEGGETFQGIIYMGFGTEIVGAPTTIGSDRTDDANLERQVNLLQDADPDFLLMTACGWTFPGMARAQASALMQKHSRYAEIPGALCNVLYTLETNHGCFQATAAMHTTPVSKVRRVFTPTKQWSEASPRSPSALEAIRAAKQQGHFNG